MCKVIECSYVQYNNATSLIKLKLAAVNANAVHPSDWPEVLYGEQYRVTTGIAAAVDVSFDDTFSFDL